MAWDDEDKGNPWRPGGEKGPADLDAIVRDLQRKLSGLFGGRAAGGKAAGRAGPRSAAVSSRSRSSCSPASGR